MLESRKKDLWVKLPKKGRGRRPESKKRYRKEWKIPARSRGLSLNCETEFEGGVCGNQSFRRREEGESGESF